MLLRTRPPQITTRLLSFLYLTSRALTTPSWTTSTNYPTGENELSLDNLGLLVRIITLLSNGWLNVWYFDYGILLHE